MALFAFSTPSGAVLPDEGRNRDEAGAASEAARLLATWTRLGRQHVSLSFGCSCGSAGVAVQLGDFEEDIGDFLVAEAERRGRADVLAFLEAHAAPADGPGGEQGLPRVASVLKALADDEPPRPAPEVGTLLVELLGRTLGSFERLHGNRFECS